MSPKRACVEVVGCALRTPHGKITEKVQLLARSILWLATVCRHSPKSENDTSFHGYRGVRYSRFISFSQGTQGNQARLVANAGGRFDFSKNHDFGGTETGSIEEHGNISCNQVVCWHMSLETRVDELMAFLAAAGRLPLRILRPPYISKMMSVIGKTEEAVSGATWGVNILMAMFGGGMIPLLFMPGFMQTLSNLSPVKWSVLAIEGAIWRGFVLSEMMLLCGILLVIGTSCVAIGTKVLSRTTY
jgi:hypothetical protein